MLDLFVINSTRKAGEAELAHNNFKAKVQKVLGFAGDSFESVDIYTNGTGGKVERKIYNFPKREAMLMAMSYLKIFLVYPSIRP